MWLHLNRRTGEPGASEAGSTPVWVNSDSIQFLQRAAGGTRIYLRDGALESIDVVEGLDEIFAAGKRIE